MVKCKENDRIQNHRIQNDMVYVYIEQESIDTISGYFTNGDIQKLHRFENVSDMVDRVKTLMESGEERFQAPLLEPHKYDKSKLPEHSMLFIIEIKYKQHNEWQGIINGGRSLNRLFKSRKELEAEIIREIEWIGRRRAQRRGLFH